MPTVPVRVAVLPHAEGLSLPAWHTEGSAGADVSAAVAEALVLEPGERRLVPTGLRFALPSGWELQVRPRSGLAAKRGVTVINTPGTIDADYRGEVFVPLVNLGAEPARIERGERVAQLILAPVYRAEWVVVASLDDTTRGSGGFGSTGG